MSSLPQRARRSVLLLLVAVGVGVALVGERVGRRAQSPFPLQPERPFALASVGGLDRSELERVPLPIEQTLRWGETLESVFQRFGLGALEAQEAIRAASDHLDPRRLRAGDPYATLVDGSGELTGFAFSRPGEGRVVLSQVDGRWRSTFHALRRSVRPYAVSGSVDGSLESSLVTAGGHAMLAYRLEDVLQWDLDFNRDLRLGDRFEVLYEIVVSDQESDRVGDVLALVYENRGVRFEAFRFGDGYYDAEGRPLRKQFLRSPLPYSSRITSRFSQRRFHPVLKVNRPHYGVDYGAPVGTQVRATAAGVVDFVGWDKGGGNTVKVRHPNGYLTAYLHLSRFAKGLRRGNRVTQGQIVGYVGSTGLATAPHLDYRVQHNQRWIDPLQLKSEPAPPIPETERARFFAVQDGFRAALGLESSDQVADTPLPLADPSDVVAAGR